MDKMYHYSDETESFLYESVNDVMESLLDAMPKPEFLDYYENNKEVVIYHYDPVPINKMSRSHLLDYVLEFMDDEYLPDFLDQTEQTPAMEAAADEFLNQVELLYPRRSFARFSSSGATEVRVRDWVDKHMPEWKP
jgi:hypothetical protein